MLRHLVEEPEELPAGYAFPNTASLVLELRERGHELSVFALDKGIQNASVHRGDGLTIYVSPMRARARHLARDLFAVERHGIGMAIKASGCDVIHAHWTYEFALGAQEARLLPLVVTAHDAPLTIARLNRHPYWWIRAAMAGVAIHRSANLTAVAPSVADHLRRVYGYRRPITVVPNGIPADIFRRVSATPDEESPTFATVSQGWSPLKNMPAALRAFAVVRDRHPRARLLLFGAGHGMGEEAQVFATAAGLDQGCEFRGAVSRHELLEALGNGITALVHPSRHEAHSVAVSEAMALGICVIGGRRSGGVPWTLAHGAAGLLTDVEDPQAVASAMLTAIESPDTRAFLATAARAHAFEHYALPVVAAQYEAVYEHALA